MALFEKLLLRLGILASTDSTTSTLEKCAYFSVVIVGSYFVVKMMIDTRRFKNASWHQKESILEPYRNLFHLYLSLSKLACLWLYKYKLLNLNINAIHGSMVLSDCLLTFWFAVMNTKYSNKEFFEHIDVNVILYWNCFVSNIAFIIGRVGVDYFG
eukprot:119190_1